jgi:ABC-type transport system involved in multi-copper enzyme maturation permease subunit
VKVIRAIFGLPLLRKELVEQAARRRTYIIRVVFALSLFFCFGVLLYEELARYEGNPFLMLGKGKDIFEFLVILLFVGVYIFLPAMVSGVITYEKERGSLGLLFLTDMGPWEILFQKLLGRLVTIFSFFLLAMPLMAIAYAFGGISADYLASAIYLLFLACFQVAAISIMVSAYCRSTGVAFLASYLLILVFYAFLPVTYNILRSLDMIGRMPETIALHIIPPAIFTEGAREGFGAVVLHSIPVIVSGIVFLFLARAFLVRRAFVHPKDLTLRIFGALDKFMNWANKITGGIVLVKDKKTLPAYKPIAWREVTKKSLGKMHYLLRLLLLIEIPVLIFGVLFALNQSGRTYPSDAAPISLIIAVLWTMAILALSVKSANALASERTSQTLDVLLTTPLTGREIVRQKMQGQRRLTYILMVPFITCFIIEAWWESYLPSYGYGPRGIDPIFYMFSSILSILIYLPMFSWVSFWIGLKVKSKSRAIAVALSTIVTWIAAPFLLVILFEALSGWYRPEPTMGIFLLFSPVFSIIATEAGDFEPVGLPAGVAVVLNFLLHGGILFYFRYLCLKKADRYLGRA